MPDLVDQALEQLPPTAGKLSNEQKRHIRRAVGEQAVRMLEDILQKATQSYVIASTVAREVQATQIGLADAEKKLGARIDGASAWCEKNEIDMARAMKTAAQLQDGFFCMSFWSRVKWLLFGYRGIGRA